MKTRIGRLACALTCCVALALVGCEIVEPEQAVVVSDEFAEGETESDVAAKRNSAQYVYLVGDGFLCELNPAFCPNVAAASNGDIVELTGQGTLDVHPKAVDGAGTFVHKDGDGNVVGSGEWHATQLLSFVEFGPSPVLPQEFRTGVANIRVHMVVDGSGAELGGILRVQCRLPEVKMPPPFAEGSRLNVQDGINFNTVVGGGTLFILQ